MRFDEQRFQCDVGRRFEQWHNRDIFRGRCQRFHPHRLRLRKQGSERAIEQAAKQSKVSVTVDYMGSLDVMDALRNKGHHAGRDYDAVWPASSMWITMGDIKHVVKDQVSTSTTPVVFGVKQSKAEELGWANTDGTTKPVFTRTLWMR